MTMKITTLKIGQFAAIIFATFFATTCLGAWQTEEPNNEARLLKKSRQLIFEGKRSGEGYFSSDGKQMVFQSERDPSNPFFQIYLLDFEFGDVTPVSPGHGKTTCAWVHPTKSNQVLFSSTHNDPEAKSKQRAEIEFRESGQTRRYSCLLYTSPSPRDQRGSRMPSSA